MSITRNTIGTFGVLALSFALGGCVIAVGNRGYTTGPDNERYYVEADSMRTLVDSNKQLTLGMSKADALALYPGDLCTLMSSAKVSDKVVEEWRVQAYEGSRQNVKTSFRRWLYFSDGELVRFSEERIEFASNPSLVESWN